MKTFKIIWEQEIYDTKTPLEAAKLCLESIIEKEALMFTVTDMETKQEYSVDLNEEDEDSVIPIGQE